MADSWSTAIIADLPVGVLWRDMNTAEVNMNMAARELLRLDRALDEHWVNQCSALMM